MSKKKKVLTEEEKFELQLQLEADCARYRRQYTMMERERSGIQAGTGTLAKGKKVLNIFTKEYKNLMSDLNIAKSHGKIRQDKVTMLQMNHLLRENEIFEDAIKTNKTHLKEINDQIYKVKKEVIECEAKQTTDAQMEARIMNGRRTLEMMENKLEVQNKKFGTILAENRKIREEIDHLIKERIHFNKLWDQIVGNLNTGKRFMMDLIEQATIAYDQREEWVAKLGALRQRAHSDLLLHTQDMCEIQHKINHDNKLEEFLNIKGQKRIMRDLEEKERKKMEMKRQKMERTIGQYRALMTRVMDFTGLNSIQQIVAEYMQNEEENFSKFQYITELNRQMEEIGYELADVRAQIDEHLSLYQLREERQKSKSENLRLELEELVTESEKLEAEFNKRTAHMTKLFDGIEKLFKLAQCDRDPLMVLLGENDKINKYNVNSYLYILEHKITELILNVYYKEKVILGKKSKNKAAFVIKEEKRKPVIYPIEDIVVTSPCPLCVEHEQVSDVIDKLQFAMDRDEIQEKLNVRLSLPGGLARLHNVSACNLPESRQIIQKRYQ